MKAFLMATQQQNIFTKDLLAILGSRYEDFNMQTASSNNEMAYMLKNDTYDLAIVNSEKDALALSTEIIASGLAMPILVYTDTNYIPFIKKLYSVGVSGVLNIADDEDELLKAVADVLANRIYISEYLKQELLRWAIKIGDRENDYEHIRQFKSPLCFNKIDISDSPIITFVTNNNLFFTLYMN